MPLLDVSPRSYDEYVAAGGGRGLDVALGASPDAVIDEVAKSGLRGRGGAGFPTGEKWRSIRGTGTGARFAVCNGAEGEPATFKDRTLLRTNPYQILEGLAIAAHAVGAERAYICVKRSFAEETQALTTAIDEMQRADALGPTPIDLILGPDLYLFGEETGLEEVIEGRLPLPRIARPFMFGLFAQPPNDNPTLVNNVETLANVAHIMADGPDWLRSSGTDDSPGTMVFTVCGDVRREGVFELPLGTPLRHLVEDRAGGPVEGRSLKAIFPGASNTVLAPSELDVPMDFDSMRAVGSGLGSAASPSSTIQRAWCEQRGSTRGSCTWSPAASARPASSAPERSPDPREGRGGGRVGPGRGGPPGAGARSTDGQKCALPTGESLLMQSVAQVFAEEFRRHVDGACPFPRELAFHLIPDWDAEAGRFRYDDAYANKRSDWTFDA